MWRLTDDKTKSRLKLARWPKVGPLGRDIEQVFAHLVYQDTSSPLPLTIWCGQEAIIILANIDDHSSDEVDITVSDEALLLTITTKLEKLPSTEGQLSEITKPESYVLPLAYQIDVNQIDSEYKDNLLHIKLPRLKPPAANEDGPAAIQ